MSELSIVSGVEYAGPGTQNAPRTCYGLSSDAWMRIGVLALLMIGLFWPNLRRLWLKTNPVTGEADWGHAFFVPLIGAYCVYRDRDALLKACVETSYLRRVIMRGGRPLFDYVVWAGERHFVRPFVIGAHRVSS